MVRPRKLQVEARAGGAPGTRRFKASQAGQSLQLVPPALKRKVQLMSIKSSSLMCPKVFRHRHLEALNSGRSVRGPPHSERLGFSLSPFMPEVVPQLPAPTASSLHH